MSKTNKTNKVSVGKKIKISRIVRDMGQVELAQKVGVAQPTISRYESGLVMPSVKVLLKLASAVNTSTEFLLRPIEDDILETMEDLGEPWASIITKRLADE